MTTPTIAAIAARHAAGETLTLDEITALVAIAIRPPALPALQAIRERNRLIVEFCRRFLWDARSQRTMALQFQNAIERFERTEWRSTASLLTNPYENESPASQLWAILKAAPPSTLPRSTQQIVNILKRQNSFANC
jgi:hypothetical protein